MFPVLLKIGVLTITGFGFFLGLGVVGGVYFFLRFARRAGFNESKILDLCFLLLLSGFFSARFFYFLRHPGLPFWQGSLSFSGGVLGTTLALSLYLRKVRWSYLKIGDGLMPAALLIFAFGEFGLFLSMRPLNLIPFLFSVFYFISFLFAASFLKREPRTGFSFYLFGAVLFFLYSLSRALTTRLFYPDSLLGLAYFVFFVLGLKNGGYVMASVYPQEFIKKLKERLLRYKGKIEEEEKQVQKEDSSLEAGQASRSADFEDEASDEMGHSFVQATLSSIRGLKAQIQRALERMRSGKYGLCERCGQPIDKARLQAFPEATLCLKCEQLREEKVVG